MKKYLIAFKGSMLTDEVRTLGTPLESAYARDINILEGAYRTYLWFDSDKLDRITPSSARRIYNVTGDLDSLSAIVKEKKKTVTATEKHLATIRTLHDSYPPSYEDVEWHEEYLHTPEMEAINEVVEKQIAKVEDKLADQRNAIDEAIREVLTILPKKELLASYMEWRLNHCPN